LRNMGILDWWRSRDHSADDPQDKELIARAVEHVVQTTNPRLRFVPRYDERLSPAVASSLKYARSVIAMMPTPHEASRAGWNSDPCMRAFFATSDDVIRSIGRAPNLHTFFDQNPAAREAYAVLNMKMIERKTLGTALEGDVIHRDVAQTTVSFEDHRIGVCGPSEPDLKQAIGRRIMEQLSLEGLARVADDRESREQLEEERALLKVRLQLQQREGMGMGSALGDTDATEQTEISRLEAELADNAKKLDKAGVGTEILDHELERVCEVLAEPTQYFFISKKRLRLDRMNVVQQENSPQAGEEIEFFIGQFTAGRLISEITTVGKPRTRAFALVRFSRTDLQTGGLRFDEAASMLI